MSYAQAAIYAYRARVDRDTVRVFRAFGYYASADHVERRAELNEAIARRLEKQGAASMTDAAPGPLSPDEPQADDLHTTPYE